ncbi:structural protein P8 [Wound tumor virus]|uniref:Outer capsid protein P8 n=1 Tax=Wound tumor virus TaxID=10987 RepID=P8_WTV|nr:structural protein P8 [Wound tumor virus]P17380.1 RecName: Full=Outer capsid protein P8; AltName: Full=Structural protein P8 [Wound tumor virus]AAA48503.1 structural protein P8 [Wound tumor virus]
MSRQNWVETSALVECISEYIVRSYGDTFIGLTSTDLSTLSNLLSNLSIANVGFLNDLRTPLQNMSNEFVDFLSTTDRCGFMLRPIWFDSDINPAVTDNFVNSYIKLRNSVPVSDVIRQVNNLSLHNDVVLKIYSVQNAIIRALDPPYGTKVDPTNLFRATALKPSNYGQRRSLCTQLGAGVEAVDFFVSERGRMVFGRRSPNALQAAQYDINVPNFWSVLDVTNARVYFTNTFLGCTITNVQVNAQNGQNPVAFIRVNTDQNDINVDSDAIVSFSLAGGVINVTTAVPMTGFAIAIEGDFHFQMNRCQSYYTGVSITLGAQVPIDDFGIMKHLEIFRMRLLACGQAEMFAESMNRLTMQLIANYTQDNFNPNAVAFATPWYRISERFGVILSFIDQNINLQTRRLMVRHLWVIYSFIAVFGRYYNIN